MEYKTGKLLERIQYDLRQIIGKYYGDEALLDTDIEQSRQMLESLLQDIDRAIENNQ